MIYKTADKHKHISGKTLWLLVIIPSIKKTNKKPNKQKQKQKTFAHHIK